MPAIRLIDLGDVPPVRSQTCYHAAAYRLGPESPDTIILVSPAEPYVSVGYHQDADKEVDRAFCRERGLPVIRREVGGGAVYLDRDQLFSQWIFRPESLPSDVGERYRLYIDPLVKAYHDLGIPAEHRPVNDVHVRGRKIGGTGAARIGGAEVLVGSFMFDFDKATMAKVLKVSSEKMRDKVFQGLQDYMTTIRELLGRRPDRRQVIDLYLRRCSEALGAEIVPGAWTEAEEAQAAELDRIFVSPEWLDQKGSFKRPGIRIHEDVQVHESALKAPGGLIRATVRVREGRIDDLSISGDFTILPRSTVPEIEEAARDAAADPGLFLEIVRKRYRENEAQSPGLAPEHWAEVLAAALKA